jgi:hypothetical protein
MDNKAKEWLQSLKVGDRVCISSTYSKRILPVSRITDTQIIVGNSKFRKSTGWLVGAGIWDTDLIIPVTKEIEDEIHLKHRQSQLRLLLDGISIYDFQIDKVDKLIDVLKDVKK